MNGLTPMAKRKAVAPIIATLLMVAIAVVGGILIFVFTQGFFTESDVSAGSTDNIAILGYDLRDVADVVGSDSLIDHGGAVVEGNADTSAADVDGQLADADYGIVYIENLGSSAVVISKLRVGDSSYLYTATNAAEISAAYPGDGKFALCTVTTCTDAGSFTSAIATLAAFSQASLIFEKDTTGTDLKNGRAVSISVETDNSGTAVISAKVGKQRGA